MAKRQFECLRCEHRFQVEYDAKAVVERSCPRCGSNSVRPEPLTKGAGSAKSVSG
jgi:Zn finger protein HypA/HybF involved in hydrogenase expression